MTKAGIFIKKFGLYLLKIMGVYIRQGRLQAINDYLARVSTSSSDPSMAYKRLSLGIETISILSAMEVPGVLMQVGRMCILDENFIVNCSEFVSKTALASDLAGSW